MSKKENTNVKHNVGLAICALVIIAFFIELYLAVIAPSINGTYDQPSGSAINP